MEEQKEILTCYYCKDKILRGEHRVILITKLNDIDIGKEHFHFNCYRTYFNRQAQKKAGKMKRFSEILANRLLKQVKKEKQINSVLNDLPKKIEETMREFKDDSNKETSDR